MTVQVLVYSDNRLVRQAVRLALGEHLPGLDRRVLLIEAATQAAALKQLDAGDVDLAIFDAEAAPAGGMGLARQIKDELDDPPPVILLVARQADAWLATWSGAEAILPHPVDPLELPKAAAALLAVPV
jgi:DNA-binding response OmpR family regulator